MDTIQDIVADDVVVYKTSDYEKFSLDDSNRPVETKRVLLMAEHMQARNWMRYSPIIVTDEYVIQDGQHRWEAAQIAEVLVYYTIAPDLDITDVATMNLLTKSWTNHDYLNFWVKQDNPDYIKLWDFHEFNPAISLSAAMFICADSNRYGMYPKFRSGLWEYGDEEVAKEIGEIVNIISLHLRVGMNQTYPRALRRIVKHDLYDSERMRMQIERKPEWLRPANTQQEAIEILQDVFNYSFKSGRVSFRRV